MSLRAWISGIELRDFVPALVVVALVGASTVLAVVAIVARQWRRARQHEYESHLKDLMLKRGLSVDEIERVIRLSATPAGEEREAASRRT